MILHIYLGISILTFAELYVIGALARKEARKRGIIVRRQKNIKEMIKGIIRTTVISFSPVLNISLLYNMFRDEEELIEEIVKYYEISDKTVKGRTTNDNNFLYKGK